MGFCIVWSMAFTAYAGNREVKRKLEPAALAAVAIASGTTGFTGPSDAA